MVRPSVVRDRPHVPQNLQEQGLAAPSDTSSTNYTPLASPMVTSPVDQTGKRDGNQCIDGVVAHAVLCPHCRPSQNGKSRQDRSRRPPCCDATSRLRRRAPRRSRAGCW